MNRLQKARFDLFQAMCGKVIPNGVLADICYNSLDDLAYRQFREIYQSNKLKYLLAVNDTTPVGYMVFWTEVFPYDSLPPYILDFLLSAEFARIKGYWQDELTDFIRNVAKEEKRPYLVKLAEALYVTHTKLDYPQVLRDMLQKQAEVQVDYDVYWGFCLVAFRFDLMTEELLPIFYEALEKHRQNLVKLT